MLDLVTLAGWKSISRLLRGEDCIYFLFFADIRDELIKVSQSSAGIIRVPCGSHKNPDRKP